MSDPAVIGFRPTPDQYAWTFGGAPRSPGSSPRRSWRYSPRTVSAAGCAARPTWSRRSASSPTSTRRPARSLSKARSRATPSPCISSPSSRRDWGASTTVPFFGALTGTHATALLHDPLPEIDLDVALDRAQGTCRFTARHGDFAVDLPLNPMHGTVGVAPANLEVRSALVPDAFGGNMDTPEMRAGVTCYLGVNVEGALFSLGDGHARQGEGETCGVAVETAMNTVLAVDLIKGRPCPWPRLESDTHIMSAGSARPLEDAFRIAQHDLVRWIAADYGLDVLDAYQLVTQAVESPLANVCDPNYTSVAKMAKRYLPTADAMDSAHSQPPRPHRTAFLITDHVARCRETPWHASRSGRRPRRPRARRPRWRPAHPG